jgi:hypothetical protein
MVQVYHRSYRNASIGLGRAVWYAGQGPKKRPTLTETIRPAVMAPTEMPAFNEGKAIG